MKIGLFTSSYKPYLSGVTISVDSLASKLRELGHEVFIFAPYYPRYQETEANVFRFPSLPSHYPNFRVALPYLKEAPELDIIHAHDPFMIGGLAKGLAKKRKVPFVFTFHTLFTRYTHHVPLLPHKVSKFILTVFIKNFCAGTDCIIVPTRMVKKALLRWHIKERIEVLPTGVEINEPATITDMRKSLGIPAGAKVMLYVGRLSKEKNLPFLVEAAQKVKDAYLLLVGGGPQLQELKNLAGPRMIVAGEKKPEELAAYYRCADVFVFASLTETQGLVLAEAKVHSLPTVALFAGGICDVVRSGVDGYITPRRRDAFVSRIEELLNDPALTRKMGQAAREDAVARFSSLIVAKRMETIYNSLIIK